MTGRAMARPYRSGFCAPSNPPDSHARCTMPSSKGADCSCFCHWAPDPVAADTVAEAAGRAPGIYPDVPEEDYHRDPTSLSVSGAKILAAEGAAAFRWEQLHPRSSKAFDFGSAAHKEVLGVGPELVVHEFDPATVKSPKATNAWKDKQKTVSAAGGILLLPSEYAVITAMAERLRENPLVMRLFSAGQPEVSCYSPDEATGVMRRCRVDWLHPTVLVDYKTSAGSVHPTALAGVYGVVRKLGYDQQAAWYLDLLRSLGHPARTFVFVFQSKDAPYNVTPVVLREDDLYDAREKNAAALALFRDCTARGTWPGPLDDDEWAVISLNQQTFTKESIAS